MVFFTGDFVDWDGEGHGSDFALDLVAQAVDQAEKLAGGEGGNVTFGQFGFDFAELLAEEIDADVAGREPFFLEMLEENGSLVLDFESEFAAPLDESGL